LKGIEVCPDKIWRILSDEVDQFSEEPKAWINITDPAEKKIKQEFNTEVIKYVNE